MAQTFPDVLSSDLISSSRGNLLDRDAALQSSFSGSAYPTTGLVVGMLCYRTDLSKIYLLEFTGPSVWVEIAFTANLGSVAGEASGTSGHTIGFLDGANTWSGVQTYAAAQALAGNSIGGNAGALTMDTDIRLNANTGKIINFLINSSAKAYIAADGGFVVGTPTGGSKGVGTINGVSLYMNGTVLGNAAVLTAGTGANNLLQLDGTGKIPALDGSQILNIGASSVFNNPQSGNYTLLQTDKSDIVSYTGSGGNTFSFTAAATLGNGWWCYVANYGTGNLTLDPNGSETLDGLTSYISYPGEVRLISCNGASFTSIVICSGTATFLSNGTWTKPPGYRGFEFQGINGGGNGASRTTTGVALGGPGGAAFTLDVPFASLAASETIVVGAGIAGVTGNTQGTNPNSSSFTVNGSTLANVTIFAQTGAQSGVTGVDSSYSTPPAGPSYSNGGSGGYGFTTETYNSGSNVWTIAYGIYPPSASVAYAGGDGGAAISTLSKQNTSAGVSLMAGNGGAGGLYTGASNGTNGAFPGGGGGGAVEGGTSGSGAAGRVRVVGLI